MRNMICMLNTNNHYSRSQINAFINSYRSRHCLIGTIIIAGLLLLLGMFLAF